MMRTGKPRPRRRKIEHGIQVGLIAWRDHMAAQWPALRLLHAIPNGAALKHSIKRTVAGTNIRYSPEGQSLRKEGLTPGIPDVFWPRARGRYHGLYIEHKSPGVSVPRDQRDVHANLREQGYFVAVSRDAEVSIDLVKRYEALGDYDPEAPELPAMSR